jgi:hypothetical protein
MTRTLAKLACLALLLVAATAAAAQDPFGRLTVDEVAGKLGKPGVFIYDDNSAETYAKGHLPGATWMSDDAVTADKLPKDKAATLIFYCHNEL